MATIALIGGIGSGKSTVASMFAELGAGVVDLDAVGHYVLETAEVKYDIGRTFGAGVFDEKGNVVRSRLAAAAFDCAEHTEWLNAITHPAIMAECRRRVAELGKLHNLVVVEVSAGESDRRALRWADAIVAVCAPEELRVKRACERGNLGEADVRARVAAQQTDEQRRQTADYVIGNEGDLDSTKNQVRQVFNAFVAN